MSISDLKIISTDCLRKDYLLPVKVLWNTEGVEDAELLLKNIDDEARFNEEPVTKLCTRTGKKAALLLDFGSEFSGGVRIVARMGRTSGQSTMPCLGSESGVMVRFGFGESVSEAMAPLGEKNSCNAHSTRVFSGRIPLYSTTEWTQTGFRFLYLELEEDDADIELVSVHGVFTYRDIPYIGSFKCNDPIFNSIYDTCAYTVHLNMQNKLWDGVKRDRLVWIGDMHPEVLTIRSVFGYNAIVDECLNYIAETNPIPKWPNDMTTYGMWYILIMYDWYYHNGKMDLLLELKNYWFNLIKQLLVLVHEDGKILREKEFELGFFFDWPTKNMHETSEAAICALLAKTLLAGAELCNLIGENETARVCKAKASLLAKGGLYHNNMKQVVAMMSLAGHISDKEAGEILTREGGRGMSTFQSYYILKAASKSVGNNQALDMLKEYYGGMLQTGATTFWEDFDLEWLKEGARIDKVLLPGEYDIHGDNGRFCYAGLRHSLCHGWSAGPAAFLAEDVLGIQIKSAGCQVVEVKPNLGGLDWVKGSYPTPYGVITVEAENVGGTLKTKIDAPKQIKIIQ